MAPATITAFDQIGPQWMSLIVEAIEHHRRFRAMPYLAPILDGYAVVAWNNLDCTSGFCADTADYLITALAGYRRFCDRHQIGTTADAIAHLIGQLERRSVVVVRASQLLS